MKRILTYLSYLYCLIEWKGSEKLTLWDRIYKRRIGFGSARKMTNSIIKTNKKSS